MGVLTAAETNVARLSLRTTDSPTLEDLTRRIAGLSTDLAALVTTVEQVDRGMKMLVDIAADHDTRLRKLELADRKMARRNVPVIVSQVGQPVTSKKEPA